jgi:short-subunit dehydrogenase
MNILLTGASRGIGFETAISLCNYNIENLILIARNLDGLNQLKDKCLQLNQNVKIEIIPVDLEDLIENERLLTDKIKLDKLDILINNAGYLINEPFISTKIEEVVKMFNVNVLAPSIMVRMCYNLLIKSANSHVVNIGSMGGFQGSSKFLGLSFYSASKAALASLSECLATEFSHTNIKVNCLALGAVNTEMLGEAFPGYKAPINAKDMGKFIADFAVNGHKHFNGKILPVSMSTP